MSTNIVIKESVEKVAGREAKSALEKGREHHNLSCIGCRNVLPGGKMPLHDDAIQKKVIRNKLVDFAFIRNGRLEEMLVRGGHRGGERSHQHGVGASTKEGIARCDGRGRSD
jgi:hypothetical protein